MNKNSFDQSYLGRHDESELEELNDITAYGGTTPSSWACGAALSIAFCPTIKCTSKCR